MRKCNQCDRIAKKDCPKCGEPLCGLCGTRKPTWGLEKKITYQKGLCRDCVQERGNNTAVNGGILVVAGIVKLIDHFKSKSDNSSVRG